MNKQIGRERYYNKAFENRNDVVKWEVLHIEKEQELNLEFISTNSKFKQGVRIAVDVGEGYIEVLGQKAKGVMLWQDNSPKIVNIKCFSSEGLLSIYNIWERDGSYNSLLLASGMVIEKKEKKIIFNCNDSGLETNFDKLIFQIELI
jgi:hypothetical protein